MVVRRDGWVEAMVRWPIGGRTRGTVVCFCGSDAAMGCSMDEMDGEDAKEEAQRRSPDAFDWSVGARRVRRRLVCQSWSF